MGEVAEAVLDGVLCQSCGVFINDIESESGGTGHPRCCDDCEEEWDYASE